MNITFKGSHLGLNMGVWTETSRLSLSCVPFSISYIDSETAKTIPVRFPFFIFTRVENQHLNKD